MHDFPESPETLATLSAIIAGHARPMQPEPTDTEPRLPRLDGIRAVVFDVYGTLFISGCGDIGILEADEGNALTAALRAVDAEGDLEAAGARGGDIIEAVIRRHHAASREAGIGTPEVDIRDVWQEVTTTLVEQGLLAAPLARPAQLRLSVEYEMRVNPVYPMPNLRSTLDELAGDYILGIVSNAQYFTPLLFHAFLGKLPADLGFDSRIAAWSWRLRTAKPGQSLYQHMLKQAQTHHQLAPEEILYIGNDMRNDIWPAGECGIRTALFAGDRRSLRWRTDDDRVADTTPDIILTDLAQLRQVLRRQ